MNNNDESKGVLLQTLVIICISVCIFGFLLSYFFYKANYIKEWVFAFLALFGSMIGGISTMLAVYKTIKHDNIQRNLLNEKLLQEEKQERNDKIIKLKMVLKYEIEMFVQHAESISLEFINSVISHLDEKEKCIIKIEDSDFYEISNSFKEFTYELLMILNEEDNDEIKRLLNFYNNFVNIKKSFKSSKNKKDIVKTLSYTVLSNEVVDLYYDVIIQPVWASMAEEFMIQDFFKKDIPDFEKRINKLYEEFENGRIHYNKEIERIIIFLEKKY